MDGGATEGDAVVAVVSRDRLSAVLTAVHRGGQGHNARVLDPARGDLRGQLRRSGVEREIDLGSHGKDAVLVMVHAPGRVGKTVDMFRRVGEFDVHVVDRAGATATRLPFATLPATADRASDHRRDAAPNG